MNRFPKLLIAAVAIIAAVGILVVLITPAPDELPSTGPHAINKLFLPASNPIYLAHSLIWTARAKIEFAVIYSGVDLLSLACTRLC